MPAVSEALWGSPSPRWRAPDFSHSETPADGTQPDRPAHWADALEESTGPSKTRCDPVTGGPRPAPVRRPVVSMPMISAELADTAEDLGRLVALVEETGERVALTEDGRPTSVLLPAAELAELEYWAQRYRAPIPRPDAAEERPPGPARHGPYMRYVHADGEHMTFTRDRVVVAELLLTEWLEMLEEWARYGRQTYMDPKQAAAFAEFLARQPPVDEEQVGSSAE